MSSSKLAWLWLSVATLLIGCKAKQALPSRALQSEFMAAFREAHDHHDLEALSKLACWDRVPPEMKRLSEDLLKNSMELPIVSLRITDEHPQGRPATLTYVRNRITYRFNLPVLSELVVENPPLSKEEFSGDYYPLAVKDGRYCIAQMAPVADPAMNQTVISSNPAGQSTESSSTGETATAPSPVTTSEASAETALPEKASEQQERALRDYNENAWFVHETMQVGQWDEALTAKITKLVKAATPDWDHANPSHSEIRGTEIAVRLRPWLAMAHSLEPPKRASALLVADRIIEMEEQDGNLEPQDTKKPPRERASHKHPKSTAQLELEKLGARFVYDEGSERYFYALNWLQQAFALDAKGRAGELAFVVLMNRGFETSQTCANGSDQFREVIRRGTEFLGEDHSPDVEARVHFMMGDAYRDIVVLASDVQDESHAYADPNNYKPEASDAKAKAIAEYRAGLALADKSTASSSAKERLRSLEAGEVPHQARFYCQLLD